MKLIAHFLAILLATALAISVSAWIFGHTLWDSTYIEHQASSNHLYDNLSTQLPASFSAADPTLPKTNSTFIDPAALQAQFSLLIPQFIDHLHKAGPAPTIDTGAFANAIGQPQPDQTNPSQPLTLGSADARLVNLGKELNTAGQYAPYAALLLIVIIVILLGSRRIPTLVRASFETTTALIFSAAILWLTPTLLAGSLAKPTILPIRIAIWPFVTAITKDMATQYAYFAAGFFIIALILLASGFFRRLLVRHSPKPKEPTGPLPPPSTVAQERG